MLQGKDDKVIRSNSDIDISSTITGVDNKGNAEIGYAYFKKALYPTSHIVFYEYNDRYYYPLALEFRLIDNNILYLTEELGINSVEKMFQMLTSSMNKEEQWSNEFVAIIVHVKQEPKYCQLLSKDFTIGPIGTVKQRHIYE
jgi:hypothetical protein